MKLSEHKLQTLVATYLSKALPPEAWFTSVDAGQGQMSPIAGAHRKARGVKAGVPDCIIVHGGRFLGIELKIPGGRTSDNQRIIADAICAAGGQWTVAYSVEEVEGALKRWGVPLRATTWSGADIDARMAEREAPKKSTRARKETAATDRIRAMEAIRSRVMF